MSRGYQQDEKGEWVIFDDDLSNHAPYTPVIVSAKTVPVGLHTKAKLLAIKCDKLEAENAKLRGALVKSAHNVGAAVSDQCSAEFLAMVPEEVGLVTARLRTGLQTIIDAGAWHGGAWCVAQARGYLHNLDFDSYPETGKPPQSESDNAG